MQFALSLARTLGWPVGLLLRHMSATEYRTWRALALIEADVDDLVAQGTDRATAYRMAWQPQRDDDDDDTTTADE